MLRILNVLLARPLFVGGGDGHQMKDLRLFWSHCQLALFTCSSQTSSSLSLDWNSLHQASIVPYHPRPHPHPHLHRFVSLLTLKRSCDQFKQRSLPPGRVSMSHANCTFTAIQLTNTMAQHDDDDGQRESRKKKHLMAWKKRAKRLDNNKRPKDNVLSNGAASR